MRRVWITLLALGAAGAMRAPAQAPQPVQLTLDLGFVNTSGNSEVTTFNLGQKLGLTRGSWVFAQTAKAIYGETDGSATAEAYEAGLRGDYVIKERVSAFTLLTYQRNPFAGIAARYAEGVGLSLRALRAPRDSLNLEGSISANQERSTADVEKTFAATRAALAYKHLFGTAAFFTQALEWLSNLNDADDQRVNSETAITAPISRQLALKAAYVVRFDNQPEPGFKDTDRIFTTGVQIVFD
jgi:putative salt-induced outer membrane protein YdiY